MSVIITKQEQIDEYFNKNVVSQSKLKLLIKGFHNYKSKVSSDENPEMYFEEKEHFLIGSAVDCILTGEKGMYEKLYHVSKISKPTPIMLSILHEVFDNAVEEDAEAVMTNDLWCYEDFILEAYLSHDYQRRQKDETKIKNLGTKAGLYFEDLKASFGKQILSKEQDETVQSIVMSLRTNFRTSRYFDRETQNRLSDIDFFYQLPIYFTHEGVDCKALLDLVVVTKDIEANKIIIEPIDLKTAYGNTEYFHSQLIKRDYQIQAAWYTLALQYWGEKEFKGARIEVKPFKFIIESKTFIGNPLVYELNNDLLNMGKVGRPPVIIDGVEVKWEIRGYESLLNEWKYYEKIGWVNSKLQIETEYKKPIILGMNGILN